MNGYSMTRILRKFPAFSAILPVYAVIAVPVFGWTVTSWLWKLPSWLNFLTAGEITAIFFYAILDGFCRKYADLYPSAAALFLTAGPHFTRSICSTWNLAGHWSCIIRSRKCSLARNDKVHLCGGLVNRLDDCQLHRDFPVDLPFDKNPFYDPCGRLVLGSVDHILISTGSPFDSLYFDCGTSEYIFRLAMTSLTRRETLKLMGALTGSALLARFHPLVNSLPNEDSQSPNIILLVIDTLSARHMSLYGYERQTTPNLERFASRASVYHSHYSGGNFTTPGTATILTGLYPWRHRAINLRRACGAYNR